MDDAIEYYTGALVQADTLHKINVTGRTFYLYRSEMLPRTTCFSAIIGHSDFGTGLCEATYTPEGLQSNPPSRFGVYQTPQAESTSD